MTSQGRGCDITAAAGGEKEEKGVGEGQGATHLVLLDGGVAQEPDVVVDVEIKEGAWGGGGGGGVWRQDDVTSQGVAVMS